MTQIIILAIAVIAAVGVYFYLKKTETKSTVESTDTESAAALLTANEIINVKDIRNRCLHTNDGFTFTYLEISGICMDLFSENEKLEYCKKASAVVSQFRFPYKYMAISSPYVIKHMVAADSDRLKKSSGLCKQMLEDDINFVTRMIIDDNKIDRRFFIALYSKDEDEKTILKRTEDVKNSLCQNGIDCEILDDSEIVKMYNYFTNPAYTAYERTDDIYLAMSQIIAKI